MLYMGRLQPIAGLVGVGTKNDKVSWCDGCVPTCSKSFCYINGGGCFMTHNKEHWVEMKEVLNTEDRVKQYNYWNSRKVPEEKKRSRNKIFIPEIKIFNK